MTITVQKMGPNTKNTGILFTLALLAPASPDINKGWAFIPSEMKEPTAEPPQVEEEFGATSQ